VKGDEDMVTLGIDAHKRTHTVVAVDDVGRRLGVRTTTGTTSEDHLGLMRWAAQFDGDRRWAVEDCRHLSRRLEADLLRGGEVLVRVPPKLMKRRLSDVVYRQLLADAQPATRATCIAQAA
jgi:transposase